MSHSLLKILGIPLGEVADYYLSKGLCVFIDPASYLDFYLHFLQIENEVRTEKEFVEIKIVTRKSYKIPCKLFISRHDDLVKEESC